jgi:hypothetical protein
MKNIEFIISGEGRIAAVAKGNHYTVSFDHPNYDQIKQALKKDDANTFIKLIDIPKTINDFGQGKVKVVNGAIYYGDTVLHTKLTDRILWMVQEGFEVTAFVTFLENLMLNPSRRAVLELYSWMEHQDIPITTDGCWLGYKYLDKVGDHQSGEPSDKQILIDVHSHTIRQWVGKVVEVPRNTVNEDWGTACAEGLHVGSISYGFSGSQRVIVKVNPRDVVSVPSGETNKCRVCRYEIVDLFDKPFAAPVVGPTGESLKGPSKNYAEIDDDIDGDEDMDDDDYGESIQGDDDYDLDN